MRDARKTRAPEKGALIFLETELHATIGLPLTNILTIQPRDPAFLLISTTLLYLKATERFGQ